MLKILFLILEFNYVFTFGYITANDIAIYEVEKTSFFADFYFELEVADIFFLNGRIRIEMYEDKFMRNYKPYQNEFEINTGIRLEFIEIGYRRFCVHPMKVFHDNYEVWPDIKYEGGKEEIYIKFTGGKDDE